RGGRLRIDEADISEPVVSPVMVEDRDLGSGIQATLRNRARTIQRGAVEHEGGIEFLLNMIRTPDRRRGRQEEERGGDRRVEHYLRRFPHVIQRELEAEAG